MLDRLSLECCCANAAVFLPRLRIAPDYERDFGYENNLVLPPVKALRVEWD